LVYLPFQLLNLEQASPVFLLCIEQLAAHGAQVIRLVDPGAHNAHSSHPHPGAHHAAPHRHCATGSGYIVGAGHATHHPLRRTHRSVPLMPAAAGGIIAWAVGARAPAVITTTAGAAPLMIVR